MIEPTDDKWFDMNKDDGKPLMEMGLGQPVEHDSEFSDGKSVSDETVERGWH